MVSGNNGLVIAVLQMSQEIGKLPDVLTVNDSNRSQIIFGPWFSLGLHQAIADQIPHGFRPIGVPLPGNELIEFPKKSAIHGNSKTNDP